MDSQIGGTSTYEHLFVTHDGEVFKMIEDESGDIWWGYGHRDGPEFIEEVNRWLIHACGVTVPDDLFASSRQVEHLWVRMDDPDGERFTVVDKPWLGSKEAANELFPVTRLMI